MSTEHKSCCEGCSVPSDALRRLSFSLRGWKPASPATPKLQKHQNRKDQRSPRRSMLVTFVVFALVVLNEYYDITLLDDEYDSSMVPTKVAFAMENTVSPFADASAKIPSSPLPFDLLRWQKDSDCSSCAEDDASKKQQAANSPGAMNDTETTTSSSSARTERVSRKRPLWGNEDEQPSPSLPHLTDLTPGVQRLGPPQLR